MQTMKRENKDNKILQGQEIR